MINVKELRIGNWINKRDQRAQVTAEMILTIQRFPVRYKPIELTKEELIKFGFKKNENLGLLIRIDNGFLIIKFEEKPKAYLVRIKPKISAFITDIKYDHQLQNLYLDLTEKELYYDQN